MPHQEPNRALARAKLETLAWEQTPEARRGRSGSRRKVLLDTTDGTGMVPLSELTDFQLRRYIGPGRLEEAGDMRKNSTSGPYQKRRELRRNAARPPATLGLGEDLPLLRQLIASTAESMEIENWKDSNLTQDAIEEGARYDLALRDALNEVVERFPPENGATADDLWDANAPYLVLMTLRREGVGIWDGSWEDFYADTSEVERFLKQKLRSFSDSSGSGSLNDVFMEAAEKTCGAYSRNASRKRPKVPSRYVDHGDPVFIIGDHVERKDGRGEGVIKDLNTQRGRIEYLIHLSNGDKLWFDESELVVPAHWKNARSKGRGPAMGARGKPGQRLAWVYGKNDNTLLVFVTKEPDGLFYTWTRKDLNGVEDWTYGFKTEREAKQEMYRLGGYDGSPRGWEEDLEQNASRRREEPDEVAARELSLYIENEYSLVGAPNSQGKAIEKNLLGHLRRGNFDIKKAEIAYMHLMETGAKKYAKEYADGKDWHQIFNKSTRELVAHEFATTFYEEHKGR